MDVERGALAERASNLSQTAGGKPRSYFMTNWKVVISAFGLCVVLVAWTSLQETEMLVSARSLPLRASFLSGAKGELERIGETQTLNAAAESAAATLQDALRKENDLWEFDSGVKLRKKYLTTFQIQRFVKGPNVWEEEDEALIVDALKELEEVQVENPVMMDIGAAYGYYSLLTKILAPSVEVHAINPNPDFRCQMSLNLLLNGVLDRVNLHPVAFGETEGPAHIDYGVSGSISTSQEPNTMVTTFDNFSNSYLRNKTVWLVKMDVEGEEARVLATSMRLLGKVKYWNVGTHNGGGHAKCLEILRNAGYEIIRSEPDSSRTKINGGIFAKYPHDVEPLE